MRVIDARRIAHEWIDEEVRSLPGFQGAYLGGSMSAMDDDLVLPDASDVDVKVLLDRADVSNDPPQKFPYRGIVLDVSYGSLDDVRDPEKVLETYYTAVHFTHPSVLSDPSGHLARLQAVVQREYARRRWVRARCQQARDTLETSLAWLDESEPIARQVVTWLFPLFFTPPMVLVADLRNPTHRRGLATLGQVLAQRGHTDLHERILGVVGSVLMTREQVEGELSSLEEAFDVAQAVRATPFHLASNISGFARSIVIGGARELIDDGHHREAMPWIAFMRSLCQTILQNDASAEMASRFSSTYQELLTAVGVPAYVDPAARHDELRRIVPDLWKVTEEIIQTNPAIHD